MTWQFKEKARARLAAETGTIVKEWGGRLPVALVFPNTYHVGMSNLGLHAIYRALNRRPDLACERAFLPDPEDVAAHARLGVPVLSLESQRPLSEFACIAFSTTYENDYLHLLQILALCGIPLRAAERGPGHPLVSMGGICAWSNPEPLALFLDWVFLGEGEEVGPEVFGRWRERRERTGDGAAARQDFLRELLAVEGVYVPRLYDVKEREDGTVADVVAHEGAPLPVPKRILEVPDAVQTASAIRTADTEFSGMGLLEVGRGCGRGCRFCLEGEVYRPVRHRHVEAILAAADALPAGGSRVGLVGACVSDYPWIEGLLAALRGRNLDVSLSSLRADGLSPGVLRALVEGGTRTVTLAPEAGTARLRGVLRKGVTDDDIFQAAGRVAAAGLSGLKLYFMVGLPTETVEDVGAIVELVKAVRHRLLAGRRNPRAAPEVTVGVSCFVPKPWTAFQWCGMTAVRDLEQRLDRVRRGCRKAGIPVTHDVPKWSYLQAILARGDRHAAELLLLALAHGGDWRRAFRGWARNPEFYATRERPLSERFPWDHFAVGTTRARLEAEYRRAMAGEAAA
jgi:radical SAM superfamily enzyme YgiQ (UPF0313 family)